MGAKYEFDKTRMEFRKVTHSVWTVLGKAVKYFLVTASLAVVYYVVFSFVINTDSERKLKRENQMYRQMYRASPPGRNLSVMSWTGCVSRTTRFIIGCSIPTRRISEAFIRTACCPTWTRYLTG